MTKPRIRLFRKVWDCRVRNLGPESQAACWAACGFGYSPADAYRDWLRQFVQAGGVL